jgi:hypothetical protein
MRMREVPTYYARKSQSCQLRAEQWHTTLLLLIHTYILSVHSRLTLHPFTLCILYIERENTFAHLERFEEEKGCRLPTIALSNLSKPQPQKISISINSLSLRLTI